MTTQIQKINPNNPIENMHQHGFQRLYLEYYCLLQDLNSEDISKIYLQGLQYNLKQSHFNHETLQHLQTDIKKAALIIEKQKNQCRKKLHAYLNADKASAKLHRLLCDYLNAEQLNTANHTTLALEQIEQAYTEHLALFQNDIFARFNLAWIHFHFFENYDAAKDHFARVIDDSLLDDNTLPQLALRYLSLCEFFLDKPIRAVSILQRAASLDKTDNLHYLYELAQVLIHTQKKATAISQIKALIKESPLYYMHTQSDPFFADIPEIDNLLARFHAAKLEAIKETTYKNWLDSDIMRQPLPQEFDAQNIFNTTYDEHLTLLAHQPYPLLCKTQRISAKLLKNLQLKTKIKLTSIDQQFTQHIKAEQKKWQAVHLAGVILIYAAALMSLATIFLFIGGDMLGLTNKEAIDWGSLVPKISAGVLGTGILGIILLQFNSPKLKQLVRKKSMLNHAID